MDHRPAAPYRWAGGRLQPVVRDRRLDRQLCPRPLCMVRRRVAARRDAAALVEARHQAAREQAAEEERLRIARELHDVVAHNVSVMAIHAGAARVSGTSSPQAMQLIESTARDTLAELNRLLGVLRKQDDAPLAPQPGLDQVDALLKAARDAGLEAALTVAGERRPPPAPPQ